MTTHHFEVEDAVAHGVHAAILIQNLRFWIQHNKANGSNGHGGRTWTYNSAKAFAQLFPYLSPDQIKRIIKKLVDDGVIVTRALSDNAWNRVNWYAFADEHAMLKMPGSPEVSHSAKSPNGSSGIAQSTERNRPITGQMKNQMENADGNHVGKFASEPARSDISDKTVKAKRKTPAKSMDHDEAIAILKDKGVEEQVARDWIQTREWNRGIVVPSVIDRHAAEAQEAGITLDDALRFMCNTSVFDFTAEMYAEYAD